MLKDNRMWQIYETVRKNTVLGVCDVGTDHAWLPIELVSSGAVPFAIATDISRPSIEKGENNISLCGLSGKIATYCANGTLGVPLDGIGDIVIAGMGGELIASILAADERLRNPALHFVLQPMTKQIELREFLYSNGFCINSESCVRDGDRIYFIMSVSYAYYKNALDTRALLLGFGTKDDRNLFDYAKKLASLLRVRLEGLRAAENSAPFADEMRTLTERLTFLDAYVKQNEPRFSPILPSSQSIPYNFFKKPRS